MQDTDNERILYVAHHLTAIDGGRIILDLDRGDYFRLEELPAAVLRALTAFPQTVDDLAAELTVSRADAEDAARELLDVGLIAGTRRRPRLRVVAVYAFLLTWYRLGLKIAGWRIVAPTGVARNSETKWLPHPRVAGEEVLAATRWAAVLPWGVPDCLPRALAVRALLRRRGYPAELVFGASRLAFAPHVWVVVDRYRVDSGRSDQSLEEFR